MIVKNDGSTIHEITKNASGHPLNRRDFLLSVSVLFLLPSAQAAIQPASGLHNLIQSQGFNSREVWLRRNIGGKTEEIQLSYAKDGALDREGYFRICHFLRDIRTNSSHLMDIGVLEILAGINAWLHLNRVGRPIWITSAYRSPETNRQAKGSKESLHLQGKAVDIRVDGLSVGQLAKIVRQLSVGGLGLYLHKDFLHVDTGGHREWKLS